MLERVVAGEATPMDLDIIASVQENIIGHCLCVLGDSMAMPVGAMVKKFRGEFEEPPASRTRLAVGLQRGGRSKRTDRDFVARSSERA